MSVSLCGDLQVVPELGVSAWTASKFKQPNGGGVPPEKGEGLGSLGPTPAARTLLSPWGPESRGPAAVGGERPSLQAWLPERVAGPTRLF